MLSQAIVANPVYEFAAEVRAGLDHAGQKSCLRSICTTTWVRRFSK